MTRRRMPAQPEGMAADDPRRPIKIRRLREERVRISGFKARHPQVDDPDFEEWETTVLSLLRELFGSSELLLRFRQLRFRNIDYQSGGFIDWSGDAEKVWQTSLQHADKILGDALEEAELPYPAAVDSGIVDLGARGKVVVNVHNQNVVSPTLHVSVAQIVEKLAALDLTDAERALAREQIQELEAETTGQGRWPVIARSLEAMKSLGKSVYRDIAVPLIVEFLKKEAGLPR